VSALQTGLGQEKKNNCMWIRSRRFDGCQGSPKIAADLGDVVIVCVVTMLLLMAAACD
jgi:hypothetical protein